MWRKPHTVGLMLGDRVCSLSCDSHLCRHLVVVLFSITYASKIEYLLAQVPDSAEVAFSPRVCSQAAM